MSGLEIASLLLGFIGAILIAIYTFPLLIRILKTKDSSIVSAPMFIVLNSGDLLFIIQGIISLVNAINKNDVVTWSVTMLPIFLANCVCIISSGITLYIKFLNLFRAKKANMTEQEYCAKLVAEANERKKNEKSK